MDEIMWFCFDGFDFITHDTKESAKTAAEAALEEFREGAGALGVY